MRDYERWYGLQISAETAFCFKSPPKIRILDELNTRNVKASSGSKSQGDIASERAKESAKYLKRLGTNPTFSGKSTVGNFLARSMAILACRQGQQWQRIDFQVPDPKGHARPKHDQSVREGDLLLRPRACMSQPALHCPPSLATTAGLPLSATRHATPKPVPGPKTAIGEPGSAMPDPIGSTSPRAVRDGIEYATAAKSFTSVVFKPNSLRSSSISMTQSAFCKCRTTILYRSSDSN